MKLPTSLTAIDIMIMLDKRQLDLAEDEDDLKHYYGDLRLILKTYIATKITRELENG